MTQPRRARLVNIRGDGVDPLLPLAFLVTGQMSEPCRSTGNRYLDSQVAVFCSHSVAGIGGKVDGQKQQLAIQVPPVFGLGQGSFYRKKPNKRGNRSEIQVRPASVWVLHKKCSSEPGQRQIGKPSLQLLEPGWGEKQSSCDRFPLKSRGKKTNKQHFLKQMGQKGHQRA